MSNTKRPKAKPSLFEIARQAKPHTAHYDIPLVDHDEGERLWSELNEARARLRQAKAFGSDDEVVKFARQAEDAQAAFDPCFRRVVFRGLPPRDLDALANEHPDPPEGEPEPDGHVSFIYHLAAASAVDADLTAEQWRELCEDTWPSAEGVALRQAVLDANYQPYFAGLPKG